MVLAKITTSEHGEPSEIDEIDGLHTAKFWREQSSLKIPSSEHCNHMNQMKTCISCMYFYFVTVVLANITTSEHGEPSEIDEIDGLHTAKFWREQSSLTFLRQNPHPTPVFLKTNIVTEVLVSSVATLDNSTSLPCAVNYASKAGKSGEEMKSLFFLNVRHFKSASVAKVRSPAMTIF